LRTKHPLHEGVGLRLYIPKTISLVVDAKEDEHIMDSADWQDLADVMEYCSSFADLKRMVKKGFDHSNVKLRYPGMAMKSYPNGSVGDWYISLLNAWGDYVVDVKKGQEFPAALDKDLLMARMAEDMNCTVKTAEKRLLTLKQGGYVKMEFGKVIFPKDNLEVEG
jgi:hypothetical protein